MNDHDALLPDNYWPIQSQSVYGSGNVQSKETKVSDTTEEILDMEAQVAFLVRLVADDEKALLAQAMRSAAAFGTADPLRWPASSYGALEDLKEIHTDRVRRMIAAHEYLTELRTSAAM